MVKDISQLIESYKNKKVEIRKRLKEFQEVLNQSDERIFAELAFCICTPQSKATVCWKAISSLMKNRLLYNGKEEEIRPFLNAVRFYDKKAKYIIRARRFFTNDRLDIKNKILPFQTSLQLRNWLIKNINGLGLKESSHFIRNIGFDYRNQLAILDRHILKNLKEFGVIKEIPKTLTRKKYLGIEKKMKSFADKLNMLVYELDLLLWSKESGVVFK